MLCTICQENIDATDPGCWCRHPACEHVFHCVCAFNMVQYDVRCPVCRSEHADVPPRPPPQLSIADVLVSVQGGVERAAEEAARETQGARQQLRSYTARRRRLLQGHPELCELRKRVATLSLANRVDQQALDLLLRQKWREASQSPEVRSGRRAMYRSAARLRRAHNRLERLVELSLGPRPDTPSPVETLRMRLQLP